MSSDRLRELLMQAVKAHDLPIVEEGDDGFVFRYQLNYIVISQLDREQPFLMISMPSIAEAEDDDDRARLTEMCNRINGTVMHAKLYLKDDGNVDISSESIIPYEIDDIGPLLFMSIDTMMSAKKQFYMLGMRSDLTDDERPADAPAPDRAGSPADMDLDELLDLPDDAFKDLIGRMAKGDATDTRPGPDDSEAAPESEKD